MTMGSACTAVFHTTKNDEEKAHMVIAREMPRLSQMKGVLAPFPLPGAPFSHTTSSGACIGYCTQKTSRGQDERRQTAVL